MANVTFTEFFQPAYDLGRLWSKVPMSSDSNSVSFQILWNIITFHGTDLVIDPGVTNPWVSGTVTSVSSVNTYYEKETFRISGLAIDVAELKQVIAADPWTSSYTNDILNFLLSGDDTISGTENGNVIKGGPGNDDIRGGGGYDIIDGGAGDDLFRIGASIDTTYLTGHSTLSGGEGYDSADLLGELSDWTFAFESNGDLLFTHKLSDQSYRLNGIEEIRVGATSHAIDAFRPVDIAKQSIKEDGIWTFKLPEGSYRDGTTFTVTDLNGNPIPSWLSFNVATRTFTGTPPSNFNGSIEIKVSANDNGIEKISTFSLDVTPVNDAPAALRLSGGHILENSFAGKLVGVLHAADADDDELSFSLVYDAQGRFRLDGNKIVVADGLKLDYEQAQSHTVVVQVSDNHGGSSTESFAIAVQDVASERVIGGSTSDVVKGGSGRDMISGGLGKDVLTGGKGKDTFVFATKGDKTNVDWITDFSVKDDTIWLDNKVFTKLGKKGTEKKPAKIDMDFFTIGAKAKDKNDYVVYNSNKGVLYYDADGSGKGKQVEIATLAKKLNITHHDFMVI